jgi:hypothetical protein
MEKQKWILWYKNNIYKLVTDADSRIKSLVIISFLVLYTQ